MTRTTKYFWSSELGVLLGYLISIITGVKCLLLYLRVILVYWTGSSGSTLNTGPVTEVSNTNVALWYVGVIYLRVRVRVQCLFCLTSNHWPSECSGHPPVCGERPTQKGLVDVGGRPTWALGLLGSSCFERVLRVDTPSIEEVSVRMWKGEVVFSETLTRLY